MELVVYDQDEHRYVPWWVALAAALLFGLIAATSAALLAGEREPAAHTSAAQAGAPTCQAALDQADAVLARSTRLNGALAAHTAVVENLLADRISASQLLEQSAAVLTEAAEDRSRFGEELAAYRLSREACTG